MPPGAMCDALFWMRMRWSASLKIVPDLQSASATFWNKPLVPNCRFLSAVNRGEFFYIAWRLHGETRAREAAAKLQQLPIVVIAADFDRATRAAASRQKHNLGYADAFAAELADRASCASGDGRSGIHEAGKHSVRLRPAAIREMTLRRS